jgi:dimethylhistidine N-methyltransferase
MPVAANLKPVLTKQDEDVTNELAEIFAGLGAATKTLPPKFFYDERGSDLFDRICDLPEYYLTRTELDIVRHNVTEMARIIGPQASLIEFGSGASIKVRILLDNLDRLAAYVPVDISKDFLVDAANKIQADYPHIEVLPVAADFTHPFDLPDPKVMPLRNVVYFPGSTIGNFSPAAALELLRVMYQEAGEDGGLLIGIDRQKDPAVLERAYNDSAGVTAEFNLNLLRHINREYGANFDLSQFRHKAHYNSIDGRIEMRLVSKVAQTVEVAGRKFDFRENEAIVTEHSHKYTIDGFAAMVRRAGFEIGKIWSDEQDWFSVCYCRRV